MNQFLGLRSLINHYYNIYIEYLVFYFKIYFILVIFGYSKNYKNILLNSNLINAIIFHLSKILYFFQFK